MKKLYIHIGLHKTGTTSIQSALSDNHSLLTRAGLSHFDKITPEFKNLYVTKGSANAWVSCFNKTLENNGCEILHKALLAKELSQLKGDVIISSEKLSFIFQKEAIEALKKELAVYFDQIYIIVYLRRQDKQAISHFQQTTKYSNHYANSFFGNESKALPSFQKHHNNYYDYNQKIATWAEIFGSENMIIRNYDEAKNNDAVADFFSIFNIDVASSLKLNSSRGFEEVKIARLLKDIPVTQNTHMHYNIMRSLNSEGKLMPSRAEAQSFYDNFKQSNYELNKKYNISVKEFLFDDDFSMYSESGNDTWDEKSANGVIANIVRSANESYGAIDPNLLFNAAKQLESSNLQMSYDLMLMISKIIPQNKAVEIILAKYQKMLSNGLTL